MSSFSLHSFDIAIILIPLFGALWGWFNGGVRLAVKLFFILVPSIAMGYYGDQIAAIGNTIGEMLGDRTSLPLGVIGSVAGMLGMAAVVGLCYLVSQVVLGMLHLHKPGSFDHYAGIGIGIVGVILISLIGFTFYIMAFPDRATRYVKDSYAWPYSRPAIAFAYPYIGDFIDRRMSALVNGLSSNGLLARLAVGGGAELTVQTLDTLVDKVKQIDFAEVVKLQKAAAKLDPDEAQKLVNAYKSGEMSEQRLRRHLNDPNFRGLSGN